MDRIEKVREIVEQLLLNISDYGKRSCAYVHLYGVAQACALLSIKRKNNVELSVIAGMLHDIYSYTNMDTQDHAHKGAVMAHSILDSLNAFTEEEKQLICTAIYNHSDKANLHNSLDEILKDADVMQHILHNPLSDVKQHEQKRFSLLKKELGLES